MRTSQEWNQLSDQNKELIISFQQNFPIPVGAIAKKLGIIVLDEFNSMDVISGYWFC